MRCYRRDTFDRWGTSEWKLGFGWWDGAFEVYLFKLILRIGPSPANYR